MSSHKELVKEMYKQLLLKKKEIDRLKKIIDYLGQEVLEIKAEILKLQDRL